MNNSKTILITRTLKNLKELINWSPIKSTALSESIAANLKNIPEIKQYINESNKENESKIFFELGKYLKYNRYKKGNFIKHTYESDNFFYMIFSGNVAKIDIKYTRIYLTFKNYLKHLIKLRLLGEDYVYKKCLKKNKKIFPFDENIDILTTKDINLKHYDDLIKKIKNEITNSRWYQEDNEVNNVQDFIELYNPKISENEFSFNLRENKYPAFLPIYIFDKILKPISLIGQLTKPKGIKFSSAYVCLSSSNVFYINKTEIDSFNNLYTLFQRKVSEDVIKKLFEGHFLFQDTDVDFLSKNYSKYFYVQNYIKGQKLIEQNTPNSGIFFINKGDFQLKTRRPFHELNELKFKIIEALNSRNKNTLIEDMDNTPALNNENIYQGLNPLQIENITKEREINFNIYKFSDVVGLNDIYDSKSGLYTFSVECISDVGEVYFLPEEILTSMCTNETIQKNIDELVGKQCSILLKEIDNKRKLFENSFKNFLTQHKEKTINRFYLRKNKPSKLMNMINISPRNFSVDYSSNFNNLNTFNKTNLSKLFRLKNKNKTLNKYPQPKNKESRILSPQILHNDNDFNSKLILKTENDRIYNRTNLKFHDRRNERNIFMQKNNIKNAFITYKEQFNILNKINEENKNGIKTINDFKSMKLKLDTDHMLNNQNKIKNIFKRNNGIKNSIKNTIQKEKNNDSNIAKNIKGSNIPKILLNIS